MGTPEFAVEPLRKLIEAGKDIVAVVTMPDKPAGRGYKLQFSAVKEYALSVGLPVLQPANLKSEEFIEELKSYKADLQIVVAFRMLPEIVWNMPESGTFNLHASLLPKYRGAAPINWAVINGEKETGVTTFFLKHEIDTGNIIMQERIDITPNDNAGTVHDKLMILGSELVLKTVEAIETGTTHPVPQPECETKPAPKIFKDMCRLNFNNNGETVRNFIRGLAPYPGAWVELENEHGEHTTMKIYEVDTESSTHDSYNGKLVCDGKKEMKISVTDGYVKLKTVQLAGKKRMTSEDLMRGTDMKKWKIINP